MKRFHYIGIILLSKRDSKRIAKVFPGMTKCCLGTCHPMATTLLYYLFLLFVVSQLHLLFTIQHFTIGVLLLSLCYFVLSDNVWSWPLIDSPFMLLFKGFYCGIFEKERGAKEYEALCSGLEVSKRSSKGLE